LINLILSVIVVARWCATTSFFCVLSCVFGLLYDFFPERLFVVVRFSMSLGFAFLVWTCYGSLFHDACCYLSRIRVETDFFNVHLANTSNIFPKIRPSHH
jgi:hypothetical protein